MDLPFDPTLAVGPIRIAWHSLWSLVGMGAGSWVSFRLARRLVKAKHFEVKEKEHTVTLTEEGIEEAQDHGEEAIWQTVPLGGSFTFHYTVRREGAQFVPRLLAVCPIRSPPQKNAHDF